jgi:hypothetical protein
VKHIIWLVACLACCTLFVADQVQGADKVRTWTNVQGRTMEAEFVREVDGDVSFLKDGKLIVIPLEQLSEADQKLIRELEANKVAPADEKPAGAQPAFVDPTVPPGKASEDVSPNGSKGDKGDTAETRVWTDIRGYKYTGKFVRVHEGFVVLLRGGRTTMTIRFSDLSSGDQAFVREVLTARGEAHLIPPAVAESQQPSQDPPGFGGPPQLPHGAPSDDLSHGRGGMPGDPNRQGENPSAQNTVPAESLARENSTGSGSDNRVIRRRRLKFDDSRQVIAALIGAPIVAAFGSLIGAIILRAAVYLVLRTHLCYGDAYSTVFLFYIANFFIGFVFAFLTNDLPDETASLYSWITLPIGFLVQAAILSSRLEISFGEALLVSLAMMLIVLVILVILAGIVLVTFPGLRSAVMQLPVGA